jgi:hypothetical protein
MKMFGKVDVGGGLSDFWSYVRQPRPHRWALMGVAAAIVFVIFYGFSKYLIPIEKPKTDIIYFDNWAENRDDAEAREQWVERAKDTTRSNALRRAEYQKLARMLGVEYDSSEADKVTRETLGDEADDLYKPRELPRSTLAERAAGIALTDKQPSADKAGVSTVAPSSTAAAKP